MVRRRRHVWFCLTALAAGWLAVGCRPTQPIAPKKAAEQKREQVYTDKTPEQWLKLIQHRSPQVREKAVDALIQYGKGQTPALTAIVENKAAGPGRLAACRALGGIGPGAKAAAPALAAALQDSGWNDRDAAAEALGRIHADVDTSAAALIAALRDTDQRVRVVAARALRPIAVGRCEDRRRVGRRAEGRRRQRPGRRSHGAAGDRSPGQGRHSRLGEGGRRTRFHLCPSRRRSVEGHSRTVTQFTAATFTGRLGTGPAPPRKKKRQWRASTLAILSALTHT